MLCLKYYRIDKEYSSWFSGYCNFITPPFLTPDFCDQHKRRLYTKAPERYPQFAEFGTSNVNWYYVDGQLKKYINGKQIQ